MKLRFPFAFFLLIVSCTLAFGQNPQQNPQYYAPDPMASIAVEVTKMSASVNELTKQMKSFVDKFQKVGGEIAFDEKQKRLILAMETLTRAEARLATLQNFQIELTEKLNETRNKLAQVELDLRPPSIERSVTLSGTTQTEEIRDNRRTRLSAEQRSLSQLSQQIASNLAETNDAVKDAQQLVYRIRRQYLPQIERELFEQ